MAKEPRYAVGEQSFKVLREDGFLYVDKTKFIKKIVGGSQYYFLGRPRRFGKSLFLSTLKFFFEGRRELFKGLYADTMDWDWAPYPVLHIALNMWDYTKPGSLVEAFNAHLIDWEKRYGVTTILDDISSRFREVIKKAYEVTGKRVVILVDEYDNPLVDTLDNPELFDEYRRQLSAIYSNFKSSADYLRRLQSLFAGYSYEMRLENENNFHNVIYMLILLLGVYVETERKTSDGRIDLLITTDKYRYVIELKVDSTPEEALSQIEQEEYALPFTIDNRSLIKIGANFSSESRRLTGWIISKE